MFYVATYLIIIIKTLFIRAVFSDNVGCLNVRAILSEGSFIDIGTPEDYQKFIEQYKAKNVYE